MGNLFTKSLENKAALFSGVGALTLIAYILYEAKEKKEFRKKLVEAMSNKSISFQEQMNQVYLKDHVRHYSIRNTAEYPIYKVAITGGPCAGKSTSM